MKVCPILLKNRLLLLASLEMQSSPLYSMMNSSFKSFFKVKAPNPTTLEIPNATGPFDPVMKQRLLFRLHIHIK